ncbi:MAG: hypothetical protein R2736_17610 [Solirubrobacterales bacterium]
MIVVVQSINSNFISTDNLLNIGDQWAPTMIMAAAMTFVLIGGGFDLSVGATLALSATLSASFLEHQPPGVAFAAVIAVGAFVGLINGLPGHEGQRQPVRRDVGHGPDRARRGTDRGRRQQHSCVQRPVRLARRGHRPNPGVVRDRGCRDDRLRTDPGLFAVRASDALGGNDQASYLLGHPHRSIRVDLRALRCGSPTADGAGRIGNGQGNLAAGIELDDRRGGADRRHLDRRMTRGGLARRGGHRPAGRHCRTSSTPRTSMRSWQLVFKGVIIIAAVGLDSFAKHPHHGPRACSCVTCGTWGAGVGEANPMAEAAEA